MKIMPLLLLFCLGLHAAAAPDPAALADALSAATALWGITVTDPIEFRVEPHLPCPSGIMGFGSIHYIASMQPVDSITTTRAYTETLDSDTTMRFDYGPSIVSHHRMFIIRINSLCDWGKLSLSATVSHEYGHILIGGNGWHSKDKHSVMYPIVMRGQRITSEDRKMVDKISRLQGYGE